MHKKDDNRETSDPYLLLVKSLHEVSQALKQFAYHETSLTYLQQKTENKAAIPKQAVLKQR